MIQRRLAGFAMLGGGMLVRSALADWAVINLNPPGWTRTQVFAVTPQGQFGKGLAPGSGNIQPTAWAGTAASATLFATPGNGGQINAALGNAQAGNYNGRASIWYGTHENRIDIHPAGYLVSDVHALSGGRQFGKVRFSVSSNPRAAMWLGTTASLTDMSPPGAVWSWIMGAHGDLQVGHAAFDNSLYPFRAGIWSGTAQSFVNVHPAGYLMSGLAAAAEGEQVGAAASPITGIDHAGLWRGSAASFVDLDPGWGLSVALATLSGVQVGYAALSPGNNTNAVIWWGTAASYHSLAQHLPPGYYNSEATSIATDGFRYYVGGHGRNPIGGDYEAFLWIRDVPGACYPNCDQATAAPALNVQDFTCFLQRYAAGEAYANCDLSTMPPMLNVADFTCFLHRFGAGCP